MLLASHALRSALCVSSTTNKLSQTGYTNPYNVHFDGKKGSLRAKNSLFFDVCSVI